MSKLDVKLDLSSAMALLDGFTVRDKRGRSRHRHLKAGSPDEADARCALVRVLLDGKIDRQLCFSLACLFDPDPEHWQQRIIKFAYRRGRGALRDHGARTEVLSHMAAQIRGGSSVNDAIESAAEKFSMSEEMAKRIWRDYRRSYDRYYGRKNWLQWV
jgi:hypothetical protein